MSNTMFPMPPGKDPVLWEKAQRRSAFKASAVTYLAVNSVLVIIWAVTSYASGRSYHFWPIWPMLGWGVGLFFQYLHAYGSSRFLSTEKEYEALERKQQG